MRSIHSQRKMIDCFTLNFKYQKISIFKSMHNKLTEFFSTLTQCCFFRPILLYQQNVRASINKSVNLQNINHTLSVPLHGSTHSFNFASAQHSNTQPWLADEDHLIIHFRYFHLGDRLQFHPPAMFVLFRGYRNAYFDGPVECMLTMFRISVGEYPEIFQKFSNQVTECLNNSHPMVKRFMNTIFIRNVELYKWSD